MYRSEDNTRPPFKQATTVESLPPSQASTSKPCSPFPLIPSIPSFNMTLMSDGHIVECCLDPGAQQLLPRATYDVMQLVRPDLPITYPQFERMWRTLLLKRSQDIYETVMCLRLEHRIPIDDNILTPAPLSDLLYSLGSLNCKVDGVRYLVRPPPIPNNPPDWWIIDPAVLNAWMITMRGLSEGYLMRKFPAPCDVEERTLFLCARYLSEENMHVSVKARYSIIHPNDGIITAANDPLFNPMPFKYYESHLNIIIPCCLTNVIPHYVCSYMS